MDNLTNISFVGLGGIVAGPNELVSQSTTVIRCSSERGPGPIGGGVEFIGCVDVAISRITLADCNYSPSLLIIESTNVDLLSLSILNSSYFNFGVQIINSNNVTIMNSVIANCTRGAGIVYQNFFDSDENEQFNFYIESLYITEIDTLSTGYSNNYGFVVEFLQDNYFVNFIVKSCRLVENISPGFLVVSSSCEYTLKIHNLLSTHGSQGFLLRQSSACANNSIPITSISDSVFTSNSGIAILNVELSPYAVTTGTLEITSSTFSNNVGNSILQVSSQAFQAVQNARNEIRSFFQVLITDTIFRDNKIMKYNTFQVVTGCADFVNIQGVTFTNSTFEDNTGTAVKLFNSVVTFEGVNIFRNNTATSTIHNGGAMNIIGNSYIMFDENSRIVFIDNHAQMFGGAIYVEGQPPVTQANVYFCFYQPLIETYTLNQPPIFTFINNTAVSAGSAVYAENVGNCDLFNENYQFVSDDATFFLDISSFNQTGESVISSPPIKLCFCNNGEKDCIGSVKFYNETYPGETIKFAVVAVGRTEGSTTGTIRLDIINGTSGSQAQLEALLFASCMNISHTVTSDMVDINHQVLVISLNGITFPDLRISLPISECNKGFHLSPTTHTCNCIQDVYNHAAATCYPSDQVIERSGRTYIGYNDLKNCTVVSFDCPVKYCKSNGINITSLANNSNVQCNSNRKGQLCGSCSENLSLVFGSDACKDCRGKQGFISLLLPFCFAGIGLVFLLLFFNLTVSVGTINTLVFLANIEKIYEPFLPSQNSIPFLSQFVAWINLDVGIETCFFDGMNAVVKVGLQFVFPVYVWLIITLIIIVSKYSSRLAKYVGNNGIPVLATLFLLSYSKLITAVILVLSRISVRCGEDTRDFWFVDPTQEYLTGGHTVLFAIAIAVMTLLITPYTFFLLLYPLQSVLTERCRQRMSWAIFKLKPFFDAYGGPHNSVFCVWPGVLLLVRIILALVVSQTEDKTASFGVLVPLLIVMLSILNSRSIYKNKYLHLIDAVYVAALLMLVFLEVLLPNNKYNFTYYLYAFVLTLSFIVFCGTLCFHGYKIQL